MARGSKLANQINSALSGILADRGLRAVFVAGDADLEDDSIQFVSENGAESVVGVQVSNEGSRGSYASIGVTFFDEAPTGVEGWVVRTVEGVENHDVKAPPAGAGADDPFMKKLAEILADNREMDPDKGPKQEGVITHPLAPELFEALTGNEAIEAIRPFNEGDGGAEVDLAEGGTMRFDIGPGCVKVTAADGSSQTVRNENGASFVDAVRKVIPDASRGAAPGR